MFGTPFISVMQQSDTHSGYRTAAYSGVFGQRLTLVLLSEDRVCRSLYLRLGIG